MCDAAAMDACKDCAVQTRPPRFPGLVRRVQALPMPLAKETFMPPSLTSSVRVGEDGFVSEATVDGWVRTGVAARGGVLLTLGDGRRLSLRDAVRVLGRRNGHTDPYGFTGRVAAIREMIRRGAAISGDSLRLGQAVYDIEYGYLAAAAA